MKNRCELSTMRSLVWTQNPSTLILVSHDFPLPKTMLLSLSIDAGQVKEVPATDSSLRTFPSTRSNRRKKLPKLPRKPDNRLSTPCPASLRNSQKRNLSPKRNSHFDNWLVFLNDCRTLIHKNWEQAWRQPSSESWSSCTTWSKTGSSMRILWWKRSSWLL